MSGNLLLNSIGKVLSSPYMTTEKYLLIFGNVMLTKTVLSSIYPTDEETFTNSIQYNLDENRLYMRISTKMTTNV